MNSLEFLEMLYETKPDDAYILLWQKKNSKWYQDIMQAATHIDNFPKDIYYGVGLSPKDYGMRRRCKAANISGIPGLYVDIDVGVGSKPYPPTMDDATQLVENAELQPTMIICSGHGIHVYWLFKEIWMFDDDYERDYAAQLNKRMGFFIKEKAEESGWTIDNVSDLARVLRPIGSMNCKDKPVPVDVILNSGPRYSDPDSLDKILPIPEVYGIEPVEHISAEEINKLQKLIHLKEVAEPPLERLDLLIEIEAEFKAAWTKVERKGKDNSPSGYHIAMVKTALRAGWTDQEIANLLIAWNRRHGLDLEKIVQRPDYMVRTIERARTWVNKTLADEYSEDLKDISGSKYQESMKDSDKKKAFEVISHHVGFKIFRLIKYIQEKKHKYKMETAKGAIFFIGPEELDIQSRFQQRILAATNKAIVMTAKNFQIVKGTYEYIIEEIVVSEESTLEGRMTMWLIEYLDGNPFLDQHEAAIDNEPFILNSHWHIYASNFKSWAYRNKHDRDDMDKLKVDLKIVGAIQKRLNPRHPDDPTKRVSKHPWMIPHSVVSPIGNTT